MGNYKKVLVSSIMAVVVCLLLGSSASAATPTLTITSASDGDSVSLNVTGDANANVIFYYYKTGYGLQINYLGKTSSSGTFSTSLSTATYGIVADTKVYVTVNGYKSNEVAWPYLSAEKVLSLSQTSVVLPLGNTTTLKVYNNGTNFVYLSSNSNPAVVNVNIEGNTVTLKGYNFGSTIVSVCAGTGTPSCASAYVTVANTGGKALAFSQNNPTVASGQSVAIKVVGGTNAYTFLSNSNPSVIQASLSIDTVTLSTTQSSGSAMVTICSSDMSACGIINAVVGNVSSSGITFSTTNPTMSIGQSLSITITGGGSSEYSIFSNSDSDVVSANISGTNLALTAYEGGSSTVIVCSSYGNCAPEVITVNYNNSSTGGSISLSQNNLWLLTGQTANITVSGGTMPYSATGYSTSILTTSFNNNTLTITAVGSGSASVSVCSSGGGCVNLSVLVNSGSSSSGTSTLSLSQNNISLAAGNSTTVSITGGGGYFIAYNSNPNVAAANVNGSLITVNALASGSADVSVCQNGGSCSVLKITVPTSSSSTTSTTTSDNWTLCASEKGQCQFSGSKVVRYGANGNYYYGTFASSALCANAVFGDPIENVAKQCYYGGTIPSGAKDVTASSSDSSNQTSSDGWTLCADEKGQCQFSGYQTVRYGASGKYYYGSYLNGASCTNAVFGDPVENVVKKCYYGGTIPTDAETSSSTTKTTSNKYNFTKTLSYGSSGNDVKQLQQRLKDEGFYSGAIDGKYLTSTVMAVKKYQKSKGITQTGNVGPLTMAALNK